MGVQLVREHSARFLLHVGGLALVILVSGCSRPIQDSTQPPSAEQAEAALAEAVRLATQGDFVDLCRLGGGNCERILEAAGANRVPETDPIILRNVPMREAKGPSESPSNRLLVVCGRGTDGKPYLTEIAILWSRGAVHALEPVYWSGLTINGPPIEQSDPLIPPRCSTA